MAENTKNTNNGRPKRPKRQWPSRAYDLFERASQPGRRIQVPEDNPEAQAKAERLVAERGLVGYRNRKGYLRDIGEPRGEHDRGRVWRWDGRYENGLRQAAQADQREDRP
jgi:hypothetical protein